MAVYRNQVVSVGMWRGQIKRWNTTFHTSTPGYASTLATAVSNASWKNPGDVAGACSGGVASVSVYNASGGAPISVTTFFDWETPSTWIPFSGTAWAGVDPNTPLDASGESALVIIGHMNGLSSTGKPVTTRKYLHAVPSRTELDYTAPDIAPAVATALAAQFGSYLMGNPAGIVPNTVTASPYYLNHQRVRGRRRTAAQVAAQSFSAGVVAGAGAGAASASGAAPFPGE